MSDDLKELIVTAHEHVRRISEILPVDEEVDRRVAEWMRDRETKTLPIRIKVRERDE